MGSRELQRLPQREREAESVDQPETESDHPAALDARGSDDIFERHVDDRSSNERLNQRRKPQEIRREVVGRSKQSYRVRHRKRGDHGDEHAKPAERNHQAQQKQEVVGSVEDMEKAQVHKAQSSLMPAWIETNQAGVAIEFERANFAPRKNQAQNRDDAQPQARKPRLDRKTRAIRLNRSVEQNIQQGLIPKHIGGIGKRRAAEVSDGALIGAKEKTRRQRDARRNHLRIAQKT